MPLYAPGLEAWISVLGGVGYTTPATRPWVDYGAADIPGVRFRREGSKVYLGGGCKSGDSGTSIFTLPAGYRPPHVVSLIHEGVTSVDGTTLQQIVISTAGVVSTYGNGGNGMHGQFLDGIFFFTDA